MRRLDEKKLRRVVRRIISEIEVPSDFEGIVTWERRSGRPPVFLTGHHKRPDRHPATRTWDEAIEHALSEPYSFPSMARALRTMRDAGSDIETDGMHVMGEHIEDILDYLGVDGKGMDAVAEDIEDQLRDSGYF